MNVKKILYLCLYIIIVFIFTSCESNENIKQIVLDEKYLCYMDNSELAERGFVKQLLKYKSDITACFEDQNGVKTLMVFAAPIHYRQNNTLRQIDDRLKNSTSPYLYESADNNLVSYFPEILNSGIKLKNVNEYTYSVENTYQLL